MQQDCERVAGLDVHRDTVVACVRIGRGDNVKLHRGKYVTTAKGVNELILFMADLGVERVAMESTGAYWKPVYYPIERLEKVLQDAGVKITSFASQVLGVSTRNMLEAMLAGEEDPKVLANLAKARMRAKIAGLEVALSVGGYANLVLAVDQARSWAGEVFAAISAAYREATGDPHALSDAELAALPLADAYGPGPGAHFCGDDHGPAVVRFHIAIDVQGECLDAGPIRAGLVEHLTERFNTTRVAVSAGFAISGQVSPAPGS